MRIFQDNYTDFARIVAVQCAEHDLAGNGCQKMTNSENSCRVKQKKSAKIGAQGVAQIGYFWAWFRASILVILGGGLLSCFCPANGVIFQNWHILWRSRSEVDFPKIGMRCKVCDFVAVKPGFCVKNNNTPH
jgi:hypothetical protein